MNKKKVKEYIVRYKEKDNYLKPCLAEGLIHGKSFYAASLCNKCKFNIGRGYNLECDIMNERLVV